VVSHSRFTGQPDQVSFLDHPVVTVGAISAELALSMAPGYDFVDCAKEFFWKPFFKDESPNFIVGLISFTGLCADTGYLTGVGGVVGNIVAGALKVVSKFVPEPLLKLVVKSFDSILKGLKRIFELIKRAPGGGLVEQISKLLTQWRRLLDSPLSVSASHAADAIDVMSKKAARHYADEAAEGIAFAVKSGKKATIEGMIDTFGDDIAEGAADVLRSLDLPGGGISDNAVRGVAASVEAVGPGNKEVVRQFAEGTGVTVGQANKAFENISSVRGTDGLDDYVTFLKNNAGNAGGMDGCVFESTVANTIQSGGLATIDGQAVGTLTRVSGDGLDGAMKVDTVTDAFAIQVKHKTTVPPNFGLAQLGGGDTALAYLDALATQAAGMSKTLALVTNCPITSTLASELASWGIKWAQVAP